LFDLCVYHNTILEKAQPLFLKKIKIYYITKINLINFFKKGLLFVLKHDKLSLG